MELQLGLSLSTANQGSSSVHHRKRSFRYAFDDGISGNDQTLPLLLWSNPQNDDGDDPPQHSDNNSFSNSFNKIDGDEDDSEDLVGWPPIKFRRRKIVRLRENYSTVDNGCADCRHGRVSNSMYVKVKMEGVAIARKIDLSIYNSFHHLKQILIAMFGICQENSASYILAYQDREGDWFLAEDVSWRSFIQAVQRLKLMRSSG